MTSQPKMIQETTKLLTLCLSVMILLVMMAVEAGATTTSVRKSSFTYYSDTGLLHKEIVEPNDSQFELVTTHTYDDFGNSDSVTTVHGGSVTDPNRQITSRTSSVSFDSRGQFPTTVTNAVGHTEISTYDARFGTTTSTIGPNGLPTTWTYDDFGRPTRETRADGTYTEYTYAYCNGVATGGYNCNGISHAAYVVTATPRAGNGDQNGPLVRTFSDRHGRELVSETQGFKDSNGTLGASIRVKTEYNSLGQTKRESLPYYVSEGLPNDHWTNYTLDDLGRVTLVTLPDGTLAKTTYQGLTTIVENHLQQTTTTVKNARGEIVSVTDNLTNTTSYTYDAFGNTTSITDSEGNVSVTVYDKAGNKLHTYDPDMGHWQYSYNVLGELKSQTDAKGQTVTMTYDKLGRPTQRAEDEGPSTPITTSTWVYDVGNKAKGKLTSTSRGTHSQSFTYDSLGRPSILSQTLDGATESFTATYDASSRLQTVQYPSGFVAEYLYNAYGYEYQLKEQGGAVLWTANKVDAQQRITEETAGNGVVTTRTFDPTQGTINTIKAGVGDSVANMAFTFDEIGNLKQRQDLTQGVTENFVYDDLNRLTCYYIGTQDCDTGSTQAKSVTYDATGNILSKSDIGSYTYGALNNTSHGQTRPHALAATSGTISATYGYDANGNMIYSQNTSGPERIIRWSSFNKVTKIFDQSGPSLKILEFTYGADRQRVKMTSSIGDTFYHSAFGVMAEQVVNGLGKVKWTNYLYAGGQMVGVHTDDDTLTTREITKSWFVADHLGSISVITDETGSVVERLAYDAWGKRRNPDGTDDTSGTLTSDTTPRGFTGHEMLDDTDLVNMNGRIYDPAIGRFLSADIFIQDPMLSQSLNRYAYVINNPLSLTDPSGHFFDGFSFMAAVKFIWSVYKTYTVIKSIIQNPQAFAINIGLQILGVPGEIASVASTAISIGLNGGDVSDIARGAILQAASAAAAQAVGDAFGHETGDFQTEAFRAVAHGVTQGIIYELGGGDFQAGFLAGGISSAAGSVAMSMEMGKHDGLMISALAGGIGAELGGGKFADGAQTGAIIYTFNHTGGASSEAESVDEIVVHAPPRFGWAKAGFKLFVYDYEDPLFGSHWAEAATLIPAAKLGKYSLKLGKVFKRGPCCFTAGTLVSTEMGLRPIEEIKVGELVWAHDPETGETALKPVTDFIPRHDRIIWEVVVTTSEGATETFETTDEHPWWVADKGEAARWRTTAELTPGLIGQTQAGDDITITAVTNTGSLDGTYNLTVADFHTYFVGQNKVLVHNCFKKYKPNSVPSELRQKVNDGLAKFNSGARGQPFQNRDGLLPKGINYRKIRIDTPNNNVRLLQGSDGSRYITFDHYQTFQQVR